MLMLADVGNHKLKLVFAIREQSGGINFVKKSFQSVILCPLFIITYCILIKLYVLSIICCCCVVYIVCSIYELLLLYILYCVVVVQTHMEELHCRMS